MFFTPYFGGCKYTNYFLFINKNIEFQWLGLLITPNRYPSATSWQLLLRLLPDSLYSGSGNVSPGRKTATTVQYFGHFSVRWCRKRIREAYKQDRCAVFLAFERTAVRRSDFLSIKEPDLEKCFIHLP